MNSFSRTSTQLSLRRSIIFRNTISSSSLLCQFRVEPFLAITVEEQQRSKYADMHVKLSQKSSNWVIRKRDSRDEENPIL
jgi:hypothetical protein